MKKKSDYLIFIYFILHYKLDLFFAKTAKLFVFFKQSKKKLFDI